MSSDDTNRDRETRYQQLLRTVEHNTGGPDHPQPAGCRPAVVVGILCPPYQPDALGKIVDVAVDNDDLFRYRDGEGTVRLTRQTADGLRAVIGEQNASDHPDRELIEAAAEAIPE